MVNRSKLKGKNTIFINESMTPDRKYLCYICNKLLMERQIHSYWFLKVNRSIYIA